jgi:toxin-antitoxin system PIN domain toxin
VSFAVDVNLLLYASAEGSPFHAQAVGFLRSCRTGSDLFYLTWPTIMGYLRMVTHPAIVSPPLAPAHASANVESLLALPHVRVLAEQEGFWTVYREVTDGLVVRGKLVPDAHLAAVLRQHGVRRLYSNDRDFARFTFLDLQNPFQ